MLPQNNPQTLSTKYNRIKSIFSQSFEQYALKPHFPIPPTISIVAKAVERSFHRLKEFRRRLKGKMAGSNCAYVDVSITCLRIDAFPSAVKLLKALASSCQDLTLISQ